jgi:hypothetical protein
MRALRAGMAIRATVRVRNRGDVVGERPSADALERVADALKRGGLSVLRVGRFGVSVEGEAEDFARTLGVALEPNRSRTVQANPREDELSDLVGSVEVTGTPERFRSS